MKLNYVIISVSDMNGAVSFYRDVLGMAVKFQSPGWSEMDTGEATVALHGSPGAAGSSGAEHFAPGQCRPGLSVPSLDEFHATMTTHGVRCVQEPKMVFGTRIAQYQDPDGLIISVAEKKER